MAFICTAFASSYPPINNQLETLSNPRNQVSMHRRQTQSYEGNYSEHNAIGTGVIRHMGNLTANQSKVIQCYNYKGDDHVARQCTQSKRAYNSTWERVDSGIYAYTQTTNAIFQSDGIDSLDSDCDEVPVAQASFMENLSNYGSDVLSEVPYYNTHNDNTVFEQNVQEMQYSKQLVIDDDSNIEITSDKYVISNKIVLESLTAKLERYKEQIKLFEERHKVYLTDREKYIDNQLREVIVDRNAKVADFQNQIHTLKLQLSATVESHKTLSTTVGVLKEESKAKEDKYLEEIIY
ncbi:hypothetical protein Tco_0985607 [Tanacetum coccineum]